MRFTSALVASMAAVIAAVPASDVVSNYEALSAKSQTLNQIAQNLNPVTMFTGGPNVLPGYKDIVTTTSKYTKDHQEDGGSSTPYSTADAADVVQAFGDFVKVHQQTLSTLIGKAGLLSTTPFTAPFGVVIRADEGAQDTYGFAIIGDVATAGGSDATMKAALQSLDVTFGEAVQTYTFGVPFTA